MTNFSDTDTFGEGDLEATADRVRSTRIEADPIELDRALTLARKRAGRGRRGEPRYLRSKAAIVSVLALGILTTGTGATLAFQGSSGQGDASSAQYVGPVPAAPGAPEEDGLPGTQGGDGETDGENPDTISGPDGEVIDDGTRGETESLPGNAESGGGDDAVQETRQVTATSDGEGGELPLTGLAAIPLTLVGLALLVSGALLQRRNTRLSS